MPQIREYIVFYISIETVGSRAALVSMGANETSLLHELEIYKKLVDAFSELTLKWDRELRAVNSYANGIGESKISVQHFGPLFLAYFPIINGNSVKAMYSLMALSLPRILRKLGTRARYVRGALTRGFGWQIAAEDCSTLYGPVMEKAWRLMTDAAYSPRIIIDPEIFKIVSERASFGPGVDGDWLPMYAVRDYDGQGIFDYLAFDLESQSAKNDTIPLIVQELEQFLGGLVCLANNLACQMFERDNSDAVRKTLPLQDYVATALCKWSGRNRKEVMEMALKWRTVK